MGVIVLSEHPSLCKDGTKGDRGLLNEENSFWIARQQLYQGFCYYYLHSVLFPLFQVAEQDTILVFQRNCWLRSVGDEWKLLFLIYSLYAIS